MSKCLEIFSSKKDIKMILLREFKDHKTVLIYNFLHTDACSSTNKIHYFKWCDVWYLIRRRMGLYFAVVCCGWTWIKWPKEMINSDCNMVLMLNYNLNELQELNNTGIALYKYIFRTLHLASILTPNTLAQLERLD